MLACSDVFQGIEPFSEEETRNLRDLFLSIDPMPEVAMCFHSAAEYWLYPYGYERGQYQDNVDEVVS